MSKLLIVIGVVVGGAIAVDKMFGEIAQHRTQPVQQQVADLKEVSNVIQPDGKFSPDRLDPKTQMGAGMKAFLSKVQTRQERLAKELAACYVPDALEWHNVSTAPGREAAVKWLDGEEKAYSTYAVDIVKIRKELPGVLGSNGQSPGAKLALEYEAKILKSRVELYQAYKGYVRAVGSTKLEKADGKYYFLDEKDRLRCNGILETCTKLEKAFGKLCQEAQDIRTRELTRVKERMASY